MNNKIKNIFASIATVLIFSNLGFSQKDLSSDSLFFNKQIEVYKNWLSSVNLSPAITLNRLRIKPDKLSLYLDFNYEAKDSAIYAWNELVRNFNELSPISLQERLLFRFVDLMEVDYSRASVMITNTPSNGELPSLDGRIFYSEQKAQVITKGSFRSPKSDSVYIDKFLLTNVKGNVIKAIETKLNSKSWLYELGNDIGEALQKEFLTKAEEIDVEIISYNPVRLRVRNIKNEVIIGDPESIRSPYESITFTIATSSESDQLKLGCIIDGRYGIGLWKIRDPRGYRDMEPEYQMALEEYCQKFTQKRLVDIVQTILKEY